MFGRLFRWLRNSPAPVAPPDAAAAGPDVTPGRETGEGGPYRRPAAESVAATVTSPSPKDWWMVPLMPAGVLEQIDVYALQYITSMVYITTNDIVLVHAGMPHVLEHRRCAPAEPEWANFTTHRLRDSVDSATSLEQHARLVTVPAYRAPHLPLSLQEGEILTRPFEPAEPPASRRVDLAPALLPELARVLRAGDPAALSAVLALLDLLARFDGHRRGEVHLSAAQHDRGDLRVGLGAPGVELLGDRADEPTRARVAAALTPGITADGTRVQALIDKREALSSSSGHLARLCLASLEVSPGGFVYEDELLWTEYDPGIEYS